ncbi:MAG: TIGR00300 family protein [Chloroflexi bacterium]|nr:TIGR00300 family protein [Chloroflexota bacterium]MCL5075041.1 TIGR00300 family protein [Chloroflexota bacterium]
MTKEQTKTRQRHQYSQVVEVKGHIIDSLIFPRILDELIDLGAEFKILRLDVGRGRTDPSYARLEVIAPSEEMLHTIVSAVQRLGATPLRVENATCTPAPKDGVFPENFYSSTNIPTLIRWEGEWIAVEHPEMDCGIVIQNGHARCVPVCEVKKGDLVAVGDKGIRVLPLERPRVPSPIFGFMGSPVSSEKPKSALIKDIADKMREVRARGGKILVVAGPAIIHTGSRDYLCRLIERRQIDYLFAGNALAAHDIEYAFYRTSLGVPLDGSQPLEQGHEHHLRAINRIRSVGGIKQAVEAGILQEGIMYTCVKYGIDYVLAGSIRDDGPLPEVVTDVIQAQSEMRKRIHDGVQLALMLSTMLHSIAVGNLLPATIYTVCVDINPAALTKMVDRGSFQTVGLVMDVASFLRELVELLEEPVSPLPAIAAKTKEH